jgi:hypothetical protein
MALIKHLFLRRRIWLRKSVFIAGQIETPAGKRKSFFRRRKYNLQSGTFSGTSSIGKRY